MGNGDSRFAPQRPRLASAFVSGYRARDARLQPRGAMRSVTFRRARTRVAPVPATRASWFWRYCQQSWISGPKKPDIVRRALRLAATPRGQWWRKTGRAGLAGLSFSCRG